MHIKLISQDVVEYKIKLVILIYFCIYWNGWHGGVVVSTVVSQLEGPGL